MNTATAKLMIFAGQKFACLKIIGRANFSTSVDFKTVMNKLQERGYTCFVMDLSECTLMDSTFLGVLSGFGLKPTAEGNSQTAPIQLLNPNARITELLENLGVLHLFKLKEGTAGINCEEVVQPTDPSKEEVTRTCLEAHRTLMDINPDNVAKFKDVTAFMAEDLKKLKDSKPDA
jgi:anti-sigma B factor antagonist